ncbi:hypothetical protein NMY22_g12292 [Coprinellus aureogranulatus]|nr:hypothetical protein NMY22_g12292 [Coprinellus aureogranulatus]
MSFLLSPSIVGLTLLLFGCTCIVAYVQAVVDRRKRNPRGLPLPPGPTGLPIIGNAHQIPGVDEYPWKTFHELCKEYDGMVYLTALGQGILVLDTLAHVTELMDKRAANSSDRPFVPALKLAGHDTWSMGEMSYTPRWRTHRRVFHQFLSPNRVADYHPIMVEQRDECLRQLREQPTEFLEHIKMYFGKTLMRTSYGIDDMDQNELFIHTAESVLDVTSDVSAPGKYLVNIFAPLKYVPEWAPGGGFRKIVKRLIEMTEPALTVPFEAAKASWKRGEGSVHPSIASSLIDCLPEEHSPNRQEMEDLGKHICATAYIAGADTSASSATGFILAMAAYPGVQKRAQAEIDAVVGSGRLPLVADRHSLPYLEAVLKEVGRWYTVAPLAVAHVTSSDDEYQGYFIPQGTSIFANSWAIMHDEGLFERPFDFVPERYLKDGKIDPSVPGPETAAFGFGRRICPGRHFNHDNSFLFAASVLATFDIAPSKDEAGNPIELKLEVLSQPIARPIPFKCEFTPRKGREV